KLSQEMLESQDALQKLSESLKKTQFFNSMNLDAASLRSRIDVLGASLKQVEKKMLEMDMRFQELEQLVIEIYSSNLSNKEESLLYSDPEILESNAKIEFVESFHPLNTAVQVAPDAAIMEKVQLGEKILSLLQRKYRNKEISQEEFEKGCRKIEALLQRLEVQ
ncbi:MAG: hypothetical protein ACXQS8_08815, partial [Candidatus Helarchaeales archaeon]